MLRVTVCVSGGGTNLQHIIDRIADGTVKNAEVVAVICNNPGAYALERAKKAGIPAVTISPKSYPAREDFNEALCKALKDFKTDLVVLAGYLVTIPQQVIEAFPNAIINIHPSLIPSFCGKGYYGLKVHEKVLERGVKVTGATVHFVDGGLDSGPILLQKAVEVCDGDTPEVLQKRVMEKAEWILLPRAIELIAEGRVVVEGRRTRILPEPEEKTKKA